MHFQEQLPLTFFTRDALRVAPALLGKIIVKKFGNEILAAKIVETEAYRGEEDEASHAFGGMKNRNAPMFRSGGVVYVYFTYGAHHCLNFVTGKPESGQAVLIRACEPVLGERVMSMNRFGSSELPEGKKRYLLTNGPGKLCQAFGITKADNNSELGKGSISVHEGERVFPGKIGTSTRIGISKAKEKEWRFYIKGNPWVSR